jgi:hypothetical protein
MEKLTFSIHYRPIPFMKKTSIALLISTAASLAGCATLNKMIEPKHNYTDGSSGISGLSHKYVVLGYDGPVRPWSEVAVITTDGTLNINAIDGRPAASLRLWKNKGLSANGRYQLHLPPGEHVLRMGFSDSRTRVRSWSLSDQTFTIKVTAGQVLHVAKWEQGTKWGINQYDGASVMSEIKSDFNALHEEHPSEAD